jgi:hypothetical protein
MYYSERKIRTDLLIYQNGKESFSYYVLLTWAQVIVYHKSLLSPSVLFKLCSECWWQEQSKVSHFHLFLGNSWEENKQNSKSIKWDDAEEEVAANWKALLAYFLFLSMHVHCSMHTLHSWEDL